MAIPGSCWLRRFAKQLCILRKLAKALTDNQHPTRHMALAANLPPFYRAAPRKEVQLRVPVRLTLNRPAALQEFPLGEEGSVSSSPNEALRALPRQSRRAAFEPPIP